MSSEQYDSNLPRPQAQRASFKFTNAFHFIEVYKGELRINIETDYTQPKAVMETETEKMPK